MAVPPQSESGKAGKSVFGMLSGPPTLQQILGRFWAHPKVESMKMLASGDTVGYHMYWR